MRRLAIFRRDNFTCQYCGRALPDDPMLLTVDHVNPLSLGGYTTPENLVTSCCACNHIKDSVSVTTVDEARAIVLQRREVLRMRFVQDLQELDAAAAIDGSPNST